MAFKRVDHSGKRFGRWSVLEFKKKAKSGRSMWLCRCDCGTEKIVAIDHVLNGASFSCGCWCAELNKNRNRTHGESKSRGNSGSKEYNAWRAIISRCTNQGCTNYKNYGARGITVCNEWRHSFEAFLRDIGRAPAERYSIDRIDVNGNYEPGNVRWATKLEQDYNRRITKKDKAMAIMAVMSFGI